MPSLHSLLLSVPVLALSLCAAPALAQDSEGGRIFAQKCTACHTVGRGRLVGPDLEGVTGRRDAAWLRRQIKAPNELIAEGDPIATQLVREANGVQMPPLGLSDSDVDALVAYLGAPAAAAQVSGETPSQFLPTLAIGVVVALGLTGAGLTFGKKQVDVR